MVTATYYNIIDQWYFDTVENIGALGYIHNSGYLYPRQYGL